MAQLPLPPSSRLPRILAGVSCLALLLAGCSAASGDADPDAPSALGEPETLAGSLQLFNWTGHVVVSEGENATLHYRPTEDALWPVAQEGILFSVDSLPQAMEVALDWEGSGEFMIMLHSHKAHGSNVYIEHVTGMDWENPKCIRVPTADLMEGPWQVMVHTKNAMQVDFTLHIGLLGGNGHIIEDDRHGHWHQDGTVEPEPHDIEPCQMIQTPAENATVPTVLPPETHFEFGASLGCAEHSPGGPACAEFRAGPGGTGSAIDGHWIELGQPYWGLQLTSTIDQVGIRHDSDCVFTDADGFMMGEAHNELEPCAGIVPEGAGWVFVYSSTWAALGITVDFALPPVEEARNSEAVVLPRGA